MEPKFIAIAVVGLVLLAVLGYFLYKMFMKKDNKPVGPAIEGPKASEPSSTTKPAGTGGTTGV